jgi:DNA-directed RNA polymerase specialized sigma24 family protein
VYRLSYAILGNEADARDAAQETFVAAWRHPRRRASAASTRGSSASPSTARMTLRSRGRRRVRGSTRSVALCRYRGAVRCRSSGCAPTPPARAARVLTLHHLMAARRELGILGIPAGTVKSRLRATLPGDRSPPEFDRDGRPWDDGAGSAYGARPVRATPDELTSTMAAIRLGARPATSNRWPRVPRPRRRPWWSWSAGWPSLDLSRGRTRGATTAPSDAAGEATASPAVRVARRVRPDRGRQPEHLLSMTPSPCATPAWTVASGGSRMVQGHAPPVPIRGSGPGSPIQPTCANTAVGDAGQEDPVRKAFAADRSGGACRPAA